MNVSEDEFLLLRWLGKEDFSQYGECHGKTLDGLVEKGLVQIHESGDHQSKFIAKGSTKMYWAVSLTEPGRKWLEEHDDRTRV